VLLIALLVCLIPTTIGGLLSAIGISGIDRLIRATCWPPAAAPWRPPATSTCCCSTRPAPSPSATAWPRTSCPRRASPAQLADAAQLASLADETPEGRSIVVLAKERFNLRGREVAAPHATFVPFTAQTRMSGVDFPARTARRAHPQGRGDAIAAHRSLGGSYPAEVAQDVEAVARAGHAAGRGRGRRSARRRRVQGRRQGRHQASASPNCARWASAP
jgi:K+-transporting ATPase ATPase B chain